MKLFNPFYIALLLVGIGLTIIFSSRQAEDASFYGLAESRATEINYNYPVVVDSILVKEGQYVRQGEELLKLSRRQSKENMADQAYRIRELKAEARLWREKTKNELTQTKLQKNSRLADLRRKIEEVQTSINQSKTLYEDLKTIIEPNPKHDHLLQEIANLEDEKVEVTALYDTRIEGLEYELSYGKNPYTVQIDRLLAEMAFNETQRVQAISVIAPTDGLVGNINCKQAEHIPSYSSLLTFYEPHSTVVKGFLHEDLTLTVKMGQSFLVSSLRDPGVIYEGQVIGLGSRIVEIPARLRKLEAIKAYGREVLIEIPSDNVFLQKEKVSIQFVDASNINY